MFYKFALLFVVCCLALTTAWPLEEYQGLVFEEPQHVLDFDEGPLLIRQARSPQGNSLGLKYGQDGAGRIGSLEYNRNLFTSGDGRGTIDAYAYGSRNFDFNRNDYGGGIRGTWRF